MDCGSGSMGDCSTMCAGGTPGCGGGSFDVDESVSSSTSDDDDDDESVLSVTLSAWWIWGALNGSTTDDDTGGGASTPLILVGENLRSGLRYLLALGRCSTGSSGGRDMKSFRSFAITSLEDSPTTAWTAGASSGFVL